MDAAGVRVLARKAQVPFVVELRNIQRRVKALDSALRRWVWNRFWRSGIASVSSCRVVSCHFFRDWRSDSNLFGRTWALSFSDGCG